MNITLKFQEIDDLIVKHTAPPVTTEMRNKLHTLRDQVEAYIEEKTKLTTDHSELVKKHQELQVAQSKKPSDSPPILRRNVGHFPRQPR